MKKISLIIIVILATVVTADMLAKPGSFWLANLVMFFLRPILVLLFDGILAMLRWNPRIFCLPEEIRHGCKVSGGIDTLMPYFLEILVPLYIIALLFTAMFFLVKGGSPRGRARAKAMLSKLFFSMVLVSMSPILYQILLDISSAMVDWISFRFLDMNKLSIVTSGDIVGAYCIYIVAIVILITTASTVLIRYFFVMIFAILFPFLLFLYFFDLTRGFGRRWIRRAVSWIFAPVIQTIFLVFTIVAVESIAPVISSAGFTLVGQAAAFLMAITGMIMVAVTPLIMGKIYGFIGGGITAFGLASNTPWVAGLGNLVEGKGADSIETTKSVLSRANYASLGFAYAQGGKSRSFGPSAPVPAFGATGGGESPAPPVAGGMSRKEAQEAASDDIKAMKDSDTSAVVTARPRSGDTSAGPKSGDTSAGSAKGIESARFSVGYHSADHHIEMGTLKSRYAKGAIAPGQDIRDEKRLGDLIKRAQEADTEFVQAEDKVESGRKELKSVKSEEVADIWRAKEEEKIRRTRLLKEGEIGEESEKRSEVGDTLRRKAKKRKRDKK